MSFMPLGSNTYGMRAPITGPTNPMIPGMNPMDGMQGLLENPLFGAGLGLLSANQRSPVPPNYAQGIMGGLQMSQSAQQSRQRQEMQKASYDMQMKQLAQQQQEWEAKQSEAQRLAEGQAQLAEMLRGGAKPEEIAAQMVTMGDTSAIDNLLKPPPGAASSIGKLAQDLQAADPTLTPQAALAQAEETMRNMRSAGAVNVNVGGGEKPISLNDLGKLADAQGNPPPVGMTMSEAAAAGYGVMSPGQRESVIQGAKLDAKSENANRASAPAIEGYYKSVENMRNNPGADTYAEVYQQRKRMAQVLAQARNPGRAPTDADVQIALQDIPDPVGLSQGVGTIAGGDPFKARMRVVEQELGIERGASGEWGKSGDVDALLEKYK